MSAPGSVGPPPLVRLELVDEAGMPTPNIKNHFSLDENLPLTIYLCSAQNGRKLVLGSFCQAESLFKLDHVCGDVGWPLGAASTHLLTITI